MLFNLIFEEVASTGAVQDGIQGNVHVIDRYLAFHVNLNRVAKYCGVSDSEITFLYNTIAFEEAIDDTALHHKGLIDAARRELHLLAE